MDINKEEKRFLETYDIHDYEIPLTTVDMAIFTIREENLEVLLVKRAEHPAKEQWALPGGFIDTNKDKSLIDTATRELHEKTGVKTPYLEQVITCGSNDRDPRGWSITVAYMALVSSEQLSLRKSDSSADVTWVPVQQVLKKRSLAFDHSEILSICHERLRNKVSYTSLPIHLLPGEFTLTELQQIFEIVLNSTVEKKSFRRRILDAGFLEETGAMKTGSNRPAKLYRCTPGGKGHLFNRSLEGPRG